jgi:hypothetical protein
MQAELSRADNTKLNIPRYVTLPENATLLQIAIANLSRVSPEEYARPGMADSFLLAAGTALIRFQKYPLNFLASSLLGSQRAEFVAALQKEGELKVEQFIIRANTGCLLIEDLAQAVRVFVKTPFANPDRC